MPKKKNVILFIQDILEAIENIEEFTQNILNLPGNRRNTFNEVYFFHICHVPLKILLTLLNPIWKFHLTIKPPQLSLQIS